jgi:hypothetical protein
MATIDFFNNDDFITLLLQYMDSKGLLALSMTNQCARNVVRCFRCLKSPCSLIQYTLQYRELHRSAYSFGMFTHDLYLSGKDRMLEFHEVLYQNPLRNMCATRHKFDPDIELDWM